ncbi:tRNA (carboxymethyluridine(34)-5-O)-methyltransferase [Malassezia caprae]|uniref:tRNA (Carboxymethyluridine(34)-5-O)-methyltransferase n=1 Tax=Malassezia caprae TaxID=1381934 RepID=A0AAF0E909_9BASI|nr:tRNA (carboxymethyluridine(34)-5-O)-methyltransferase [Malassezia caprae]
MDGKDVADFETVAYELSTQASEVIYATQGTAALATCLKDAWKSFPSVLWTGSLSQSSTPTESHADAVAVLDALCQAMTPTATSLHMECFHERIEMSDADAPVEKIMTFTSGGRIIVLDLELGLCRKDDRWAPSVGLHISYATGDSAMVPDNNKQLENMLCAWLQQLMHVLFGLEVDPRVLARCKPSNENTALAQAMRLWDSFVSSLAILASIDGIMVEPTQESKEDLFQRFASLCASAEDVCAKEARTLASHYGKHVDFSVDLQEQPDIVDLLQRYGHGVSLCHYHTPYLSLAFTSQHMATVRICPTLIPFASEEDAPVVSARRLVDMPAEVNQVWHAQGHYADRPIRPLAYIAQVEPPMAIPHSMARSVYGACGLASHRLETSRDESQSGFLAQNLTSKSSYQAYLHDEGVREVSALPFQCLARLYRALEILQECAQWTRVLRGTENDTSKRPMCTLQLEPDTAQGTCRLRLHTTAAHAPTTMINATAWPMLTNKTGWAWEAKAMRWDGTAIGSTTSNETTSADEMHWPDHLVLVRIRDILDAWAGTL